MKLHRMMFVLFACAAFSAPLSAAGVKDEAREKVETAIPEGIRLLEAKEYAVFLKAFVPPELLGRLTEKTTLEEFAKQFSEQKGPRLLKALQSIKGTKPLLSDDGLKATFKPKDDTGKERTLVFVKIGKYWYIGN